MKVASAFFIVAAALVAAEDDITTSGTTTITATTTRTVTIKSCNPTYTDCPYMSMSADPASPTPSTMNTKTMYSTSSYMNNTSAYVVAPTSAQIPGPNSSSPVTVPENGAYSVFASSGLLLGILAGGAVLL